MESVVGPYHQALSDDLILRTESAWQTTTQIISISNTLGRIGCGLTTCLLYSLTNTNQPIRIISKRANEIKSLVTDFVLSTCELSIVSQETKVVIPQSQNGVCIIYSCSQSKFPLTLLICNRLKRYFDIEFRHDSKNLYCCLWCLYLRRAQHRSWWWDRSTER